VHLSWNLSAVKAIFYVNDSLTPSRAAGASELQPLAHHAARRALRAAQTAQKAIAETEGTTVPIVQYRLTSECYDGAPSAQRVQAARAARGAPAGSSIHAIHAAAGEVFADPPLL
jgi:hypothetical protein